MSLLFWDASALAKRYVSEQGTPVVNALFHASLSVIHLSTYLGYAETAAILRRRFNAGGLNLRDYNIARGVLAEEILSNGAWELLSVVDADVLAGMTLTDRHNLNCTDASLLIAFQRHARVTADPNCIVVASDLRLLRAAVAEGFRTLNPELISVDDLPTILDAS